MPLSESPCFPDGPPSPPPPLLLLQPSTSQNVLPCQLMCVGCFYKVACIGKSTPHPLPHLVNTLQNTPSCQLMCVGCFHKVARRLEEGKPTRTYHGFLQHHMGFVPHCGQTGMGMGMEFLTCGLPVPNPNLSNFIEITSQNIYYGGVHIFHYYDSFHLQIIAFQFIWTSLTTGKC